MKIGIMGAMPEEVTSIQTLLDNTHSTVLAERTFCQGQYKDHSAVVVFSRWGKVAAATTATLLIERFKVDALIFTGVAGGIGSQLQIGDIVIADQCIQHDMDATPLFPKFQIPLTNRSYLSPCPALTQKLSAAVDHFLVNDFDATIEQSIKQAFNLNQVKRHTGTVASGDQFIDCAARVSGLQRQIDNLVAIEMEGASVGQVCAEHGVPFAIMRTISDKADTDAAIDFNQFVTQVAPFYASGCIRYLFLD